LQPRQAIPLGTLQQYLIALLQGWVERSETHHLILPPQRDDPKSSTIVRKYEQNKRWVSLRSARPPLTNCPTGKTLPVFRSPSSDHCENIFIYRNSDLSYVQITPTRREGRFAIVTTRGLGGGGRGSVGASA
jgi:hypothetical protein